MISSEKVSHLPASYINEDRTNVVGNDGFPQFQNKVEVKSNYFNGIKVYEIKVYLTKLSLLWVVGFRQ